MQCVLVTGDVSTGFTIYGPFPDNASAHQWATCNSVTDLEYANWDIVPLSSQFAEDEESEKEVPATGPIKRVEATLIGGVFDVEFVDPDVRVVLRDYDFDDASAKVLEDEHGARYTERVFGD